MRLRWRRRPSGREITCQQAVGLVMDYIDGNLSDAARARFERHLIECPMCTEHLKQIELTVAVSGELRDEDLDPIARQDLMALYRRWQDDQRA